MTKVVKFETTDSSGFHWEKEGDFGLIAVGTSIPGKNDVEAGVEVDFTATNTTQIAISIATALLVAHRTDPLIATKAIDLYKQEL